jgi:hypothetical protein
VGLCLALSGCAHTKFRLLVPLAPGIVTPSTLIEVETVDAGRMSFSGPDTTDRYLQGEYRDRIQDNLAPLIVQALRDKGYKAELVGEDMHDGRFLTLSGWCTNHDVTSAVGSQVAEGALGGPSLSNATRTMGQAMAGPRMDSKLHIHFTLTENVQGRVLAEIRGGFNGRR